MVYVSQVEVLLNSLTSKEIFARKQSSKNNPLLWKGEGLLLNLMRTGQIENFRCQEVIFEYV